MDSGEISAVIAGAFACAAAVMASRTRTTAVRRKEASDVINAETARQKVLAELDDVAMDRALKINDDVIAGLNDRITGLVEQHQRERRSDQARIARLTSRVDHLEQTLRDNGLPIPPWTPMEPIP
jgi:hypothetical protein